MNGITASERLIIVTGKGGVGRSTVATALARVFAAAGDRTILVTPDTRDDRHPLLGAPLAYAPQQLAPKLWLCRVDALEAIREYARRRLPLSGLYERFFRSRTFRDFAAAAPGFDELMCLGRLYDLATHGDYERVVFDGPATGHLRQLLAVPGATLRAVAVGPLSHNAMKIQDLLLDSARTRVLPVTGAEELPVREVLELLDFCRTQGLSSGPVLVNRLLPASFAAEELPRLQALAEATPSTPLARAVAVALRQAARYAAQQAALAPLRGARLCPIPRHVQGSHDAEALLAHVAVALGPLLEGGVATQPAVSP